MTRYSFGATAADFVTDQLGNFQGSRTATIWTAQTAGTDITALCLRPDGTPFPGGLLVSGDGTSLPKGMVQFLGPDDGTVAVWVDFGGGRVKSVAWDGFAEKDDVPRSAYQPINVRNYPYSAWGDGLSHPLSTFYATIGAAQVRFPHAERLTDEWDTVAIREAGYDAQAQGRAVYAPAGQYNINSWLTSYDGFAFAGYHIAGDGPGKTVLLDNFVPYALQTPPIAGRARFMFQAEGSQGTDVTLTAPVVAGTQSIVLPVGTSMTQWVVGSYLKIKDPSVFMYSYQYDPTDPLAIAGVAILGEYLRIAKVDVATRTLTFWSEVEFNYTTGSIVRPNTMSRGYDIHNLSVVNPNPPMYLGAGSAAVSMRWVERFRMTNVEFHGLDRDVVTINACIDFAALNCHSYGTDTTISAAYENGGPYFFTFTGGATNGLILGCNQHRGRHLTTTTSDNTGIECSHIKVQSCNAYEHHGAGFDQHPGGARYMEYADCQTHGADILDDSTGLVDDFSVGIQIRSRLTTVSNFQASGVGIGINVVFGNDNVVDGFEVGQCNIGLQVSNAPGTKVRRGSIRNARTTGVNVAKNAELLSMPNVDIDDVEVYGDPSGYAFDFSSYWHATWRVSRLVADTATRKMIGRPAPTIPSAATMFFPSTSDSWSVTGTNGITSITADQLQMGRVLRLTFTGVLTVTDGSNLKLNGNLVTAAETTLTLVCQDGINWYEIARTPSAPDLSDSYRTVAERGGTVPGGASASTRVLIVDGPAVTPASAASGRATFPIKAARYPSAVPGKTRKVLLDVSLITNDVAPGTTLTFGLYPVSGVSGASGFNAAALGTVVAGSQVAIVTPAADSIVLADSTDFAIPADGLYAIAVVTAGALAAGGDVAFRAQLRQRWA